MSSSLAFDGFFAITGLLVLSWFLSIVQLSFVWATASQWKSILKQEDEFLAVSQRKTSSDNVHDPEAFFVGSKLNSSNLASLKVCLLRKNRVYNDSLIGLDTTILIGGLILWIPMLAFLIKHKLPSLYSFWRGSYLILTGIFFVLTGLGSLILCCVIASSAGQENHDRLVECLVILTADVDKFYRDNPNSDKITEFDKWDTNPDGVVTLSAPTWFLLIMTCLRGYGDHNVFEIVKAKIGSKSSHMPHLLNIALHRVTKHDTFVVIYGRPYSIWLLGKLNLCPKESGNPSIQAFLAMLLLLAGPFICVSLWKAYGKKSKVGASVAIMSITDMHKLSVLLPLTPTASRAARKSKMLHLTPTASAGNIHEMPKK